MAGKKDKSPIVARDTNAAKISDNGITMQHYSKAWDMFMTGHTVQQIMLSVGLSRPQIDWLVRVGDNKREMPCFASRAGELSAELRKRDQEISEIVGNGAVEWAKLKKDLVVSSTRLANGLVSALGAMIAKPASRIAIGEGTPQDFKTMQATLALRDSLKALAPYSEYKSLTDLVTVLSDIQDPGLDKQAKDSLKPEATMPASVAMIEDVVGPLESTHDPMADLMPGWENWSSAEKTHFIETGEMPGQQRALVEDTKKSK